jgi:quercetin dioxygenase-like cupin family protein
MSEDGGQSWQDHLTMIQNVTPPFLPANAEVMTVVVAWPPGFEGAPPHRHLGGPVFGYVIEGEMLFELEGQAPRIIKAGEAFWEPGGELIHYCDANNRSDVPLRFVVTMMCVPGQPMLTLVEREELEARNHQRIKLTNHE